MTKKETNFSGTLSEAVSVATSVAYTRQEIQKLKTELVSLLEKKTAEVIVEQIPGPVGPRGALGATGAQGPKGDKGDKGDVGERGEKGDVGQQGEIGPEGLPGIKGDKGDIGPQGIQGITGNRGEKGDKGEDGKNGLDGRDGEAGSIGPAGPTGEKGLQGERGEKGDKGDRGDSGKDGQQGIQGSVGPRGEIGPQGIQGVPGKDGKDGDVKPVEEKFKKFQDVLEKDLQQYKNRINASVSKAMATDAWKATGSGEVNLRYLDDVDRDSIQDGYVLSYDGASQKFEFISPSAASFTPTDVQQVFAEVKNAENVTLTKGQAVYLFGATGNKASVKLARNGLDATSAKTLGLVYSNSITPGGTGFVITQGQLVGVNTQAYNEGDTLYLANTAGNLTKVKPFAPEHIVFIGIVERANQGQGEIYVNPQNGFELDEIHDVNINHNVALANAHIIVYNSTLSVWENRPISYLGVSGTDDVARTIANSAFTQANSAFAQANTATSLAQAAYNQANTGGAGATESLNVIFDNSNATQYKVVALNSNAETVLATSLEIGQIDRVLGVLDNAGETVTFGAITNPSWTWTPEQSLYLGSNGTIATTSTIDGAAFSLKIGYAISSTKAFIKIGTPVVL